jgi:predicted nucleotide-binding protein
VQKATVFIGSSSEQLPVARLLRQRLASDAEVAVWDEGIFNLGNPTLTDLLTAVETYDFAIFVFAADDLATIREKQEHMVRDNVVFELGLFMGRLGRARTFWVVPKGPTPVHIPSDLSGINTAQLDISILT